MKPRTFLPLAVALLLALPTAAQAQEDPRIAKADVPYQEGLKLHDKDREAEALEKFKQAYAIYPSPNILFSMARAEQILGKNIDALDHYRKAMKDPLLGKRNIEFGKKYIPELEAKIGRVTITGPAGARVVVRGQEMKLPLAGPIEVDPGPLTVMASLDGKAYEGTADAVAGKETTLELKASGGAAPPLPTTTTNGDVHDVSPPPAAVEGRSFWGVRSYVGLSLVAVGAIGVGAGFVFSGQQSDEQTRLDDVGKQVPPGGCATSTPPAQCAELKDAQDQRDAAKNRATIAFVAGGVLATAGLGLIVSAAVAPHKTTSTNRLRLIPITGRHEAGLLLQSSF